MRWTIPVPGYEMPEARVFAHPTRMADAWAAEPEEIVAPARQVEPLEFVVKVADGDTGELGYERPTRNPMRRMRRWRTLDMSGRFVYDARYQTDSNMGHYLTETAPKILTARQRLVEEYGEDVAFHVILRERPLPMAIQVFEALGLPVIATEAKVVGRIVTATTRDSADRSKGAAATNAGRGVTGLAPELYGDLRERLQSGGPAHDKIFISRKSCRMIENEREITDLLAARGFRKVYFENDEMPVLEQWRVIAQAREIVAIHGAGLTSLVFNPHGLARPAGDLGGLRVTELYGAGYFVPFNRALAAVMNARWRGVRGRITPEIIRDLDFRGGGRVHQASNFRVDPLTLEMALEESAVHCSEAMA